MQLPWKREAWPNALMTKSFLQAINWSAPEYRMRSFTVFGMMNKGIELWKLLRNILRRDSFATILNWKKFKKTFSTFHQSSTSKKNIKKFTTQYIFSFCCRNPLIDCSDYEQLPKLDLSYWLWENDLIPSVTFPASKIHKNQLNLLKNTFNINHSYIKHNNWLTWLTSSLSTI